MNSQKSDKVEISIEETSEGHEIILPDVKVNEKLSIKDKSGNFNLEIKDGTVTINATSKIILNSSRVEFGEKSFHPLIFGDYLLEYLNSFVQLYNSHLHPGQRSGEMPVIPAPPAPSVPMIPSKILSEISKTE